MKKLTLALVSAFVLVLAASRVEAADDASAAVIITITKQTPIETFAANGDIVAVSEAKVGARFRLVSVNGPEVMLQDAGGTQYRIDLSSTDYNPNKAVSSTSPGSAPSAATPTPPATASDNPFGTPVQTSPPPSSQAVN
jgi:hypothetical protein